MSEEPLGSIRARSPLLPHGAYDEDFGALDLALKNRDWFIQLIWTRPWFDPVRDDPRFCSVLKRMNLTE